MTFTVQQKTALAKLMATENLSVEHQKIQTAKFDPIKRVLYLPIWQDMNGFIYDLLTGHEVGHALYTPAEGWHDVASDTSKGRYYKNFLNVVEDARIEKKIQRKYPGLRPSFIKAYNELMNRDFFGIKNKEIDGLPFIDRLNIFTKSQYSASWISFSVQEELIIERIKTLETWDDVLKLTQEIYDYSKEEQSEMFQEVYNDFDFDDNNDDDYDSDEYGDYDYDDSTETEDSNDNSQNKNSGKSEDSDENDTENSETNNSTDGNSENTEDEEDDTTEKINRFKDSNPYNGQFQPRCETDETFRQKESILLDEKSKEYVYIQIPKPKLEKIITPWKRVQEQMTQFYEKEISEYHFYTKEDVNSWVRDFKNKNERYIGLLAKEFEMRKAAKAFSKLKISDTGDIDINKLASYKFDDNIFRKVMKVPKGKSHGLVLLLDKSGSMGDNMAGSIEQVLVLSLFCRKVNIPFVVYGFGNSSEALACDLDCNPGDRTMLADYWNTFESNQGTLALDSVRLREYLNSSMTNAEFSMALRNMICLLSAFERRFSRNYYAARRAYGIPPSEDMSNTPLTEALVATASIMKDFKRKNNLDLTSLVIVHDGDADWVRCYNYIITNKDGESRVYREQFNTDSQNVILCDRKNKYEKKLVSSGLHRSNIMYDVLDWFKTTTGSKVFGFFLTGPKGSDIKNSIYNRYHFEDGSDLHQLRNKSFWTFDTKLKDLIKQMKKEKFLSSKPYGYNEFFLVAGGDDLKTEQEEIDVGEGKVTSAKLTKAFMKFNKKKSINRVLVSKFIAGMST